MNIWPYVYCIKNLKTGEFYFGSRYANVRAKRTPSQDLFHFYKSSSKIVKEQIQTYGIEAFKFEILFSVDEYADKSSPTLEAYWHEQDLIKKHSKDPKCLNRCYIERDSVKRAWSGAGNTYTMTEEHKAKIKVAQIGKPKSEEHLANMRAASIKRRGQKGKVHSRETIERIRNLVKGFKHTPETCQNMSRSSKKRFANRTQEEKERVGALTSETMKKSHANRTQEQKELTRQKKIAAFALHTPEQRAELNARRSEAAKKRWAKFHQEKLALLSHPLDVQVE